MVRTNDKDRKRLTERIEDALNHIAYAEAGELYSQRRLEKEKMAGRETKVVCVEGETASGLCV